jgi:hypothetical protein
MRALTIGGEQSNLCRPDMLLRRVLVPDESVQSAMVNGRNKDRYSRAYPTGSDPAQLKAIQIRTQIPDFIHYFLS